MTRKTIRIILQAALLTLVLASLAFAVAHVKRGPRGSVQWLNPSAQTLTEVEILPEGRWGFGSVPTVLTTASGAPIVLTTSNGTLVRGDSTTKCGFFAVYRYNLRAWNYDEPTGTLSYTCD